MLSCTSLVSNLLLLTTHARDFTLQDSMQKLIRDPRNTYGRYVEDYLQLLKMGILIAAIALKALSAMDY